MAFYALNLFDLADNDDYLAYSRHSVAAVGKYGGKVVALGHQGTDLLTTPTPVRSVMVLVEWPDRAALAGFLVDPELAHLHPLREGGTLNYLWWGYDRLDDLRPLFKRG
jgi:uncharacterized protein (DUF1330 family)